jgi:hypothetical protein
MRDEMRAGTARQRPVFGEPCSESADYRWRRSCSWAAATKVWTAATIGTRSAFDRRLRPPAGPKALIGNVFCQLCATRRSKARC